MELDCLEWLTHNRFLTNPTMLLWIWPVATKFIQIQFWIEGWISLCQHGVWTNLTFSHNIYTFCCFRLWICYKSQLSHKNIFQGMVADLAFQLSHKNVFLLQIVLITFILECVKPMPRHNEQHFRKLAISPFEGRKR